MAGTALPRRPASRRRPLLQTVLGCVVLVLLMGCDGTVTPDGPDDTSQTSTGSDTETDTQTGTGTETTSTDSPTTETFTTPPTEDQNGTEDAEEAGDEIAIDVPGLPIGGFDEVDPTDATLRCAILNWSGPPDLPPGLTLEVTSLAVAPAGVYEWTDGGCSGAHPPCLFTPGVLADPGQCEVSVRQVAASPDGFGEIAFQSGQVTCAPEAESVCTEFRAALTGGGDVDTVTWFDALTQWPEPTTETTDAPTTTDPPTTDPPTTDPTSDVSETTG